MPNEKEAARLTNTWLNNTYKNTLGYLGTVKRDGEEFARYRTADGKLWSKNLREKNSKWVQVIEPGQLYNLGTAQFAPPRNILPVKSSARIQEDIVKRPPGIIPTVKFDSTLHNTLRGERSLAAITRGTPVFGDIVSTEDKLKKALVSLRDALESNPDIYRHVNDINIEDNPVVGYAGRWGNPGMAPGKGSRTLTLNTANMVKSMGASNFKAAPGKGWHGTQFNKETLEDVKNVVFHELAHSLEQSNRKAYAALLSDKHQNFARTISHYAADVSKQHSKYKPFYMSSEIPAELISHSKTSPVEYWARARKYLGKIGANNLRAILSDIHGVGPDAVLPVAKAMGVSVPNSVEEWKDMNRVRGARGDIERSDLAGTYQSPGFIGATPSNPMGTLSLEEYEKHIRGRARDIAARKRHTRG